MWSLFYVVNASYVHKYIGFIGQKLSVDGKPKWKEKDEFSNLLLHRSAQNHLLISHLLTCLLPCLLLISLYSTGKPPTFFLFLFLLSCSPTDMLDFMYTLLCCWSFSYFPFLYCCVFYPQKSERIFLETGASEESTESEVFHPVSQFNRFTFPYWLT